MKNKSIQVAVFDFAPAQWIMFTPNDHISIRNAAGDAPTYIYWVISQRAGIAVIILGLDVSFKVELK